MIDDELIWRIAGGSGDGIDSTSQNFAKALMRAGLHVFTHRHYPSRIRGGHTYVEIRAANEPVKSRGDGYNFLIALGDSFARNPDENAVYGNEEIKPLAENLDDLREGGVIVYDSGLIDADEIPDFDRRVEENNWHVYPIDLRGMARDVGREVMRNTASVGATAALLDMDLDIIEALMHDAMSGDILEQNLEILEHGSEYVETEFEFTHDLRVPTGTNDEDMVFVGGSHAIAFAAIDEGCRFISGYPMTPWTDVFHILSQLLPDMGGIAEQVEDEIAAAALAVGASHAGAKAMSGSSGGGFALMSEPLGMAEMTETPVVLIEAMRAGPSTGIPTKTEQGDLEHILYTSQGDSNRVVFAPGTPQEAYEQTRVAFQLAYEYHLPAIIVYDQKLSGEYVTIPASFFDRDVNPDLGSVITEAELEDAVHDAFGKFHRYQHDPENGVSERSLPGMSGGRFLASGNEHSPTGHLEEDPTNRVQQVERRLRKFEAIRADLDERPSNQTFYGPSDAEYGLISWGSTAGAVEEAVDDLTDDGHRVKSVNVSDLYPFPEHEISDFIDSVEHAFVVEMNASAQFRGLLQKELGRYGDTLTSVLKYNGNPFEPGDVVEAVETEIAGTGDPLEAQIRIDAGGGD